MTLSIIIPTLNEEENLPNLLESIKKQDFSDYEIIVADAESKDRTREIAEEYGARVVEGGLPAEGRNRGAASAQGKILLFLDADALLPPNFLKDSLEEFEKRNLGVAAAPLKPLSEKMMDKFLYKSVDFYFKLTEKIWPHSTGTCIFSRKWVHEKLGGFDEDVKLAEDHDYARRAQKITKCGYLSVAIDNYVRRLEKDGRLKTGVKYTLCELHRIFLGEVRSDIFNYKFDHYNKKDKEILN